MNFHISIRRTALTSIHFLTKSGVTNLAEKSTESEWFEAASDLCVNWSETERTMPPTSCADISMPTFELQEDILNIDRDIN